MRTPFGVAFSPLPPISAAAAAADDDTYAADLTVVVAALVCAVAFMCVLAIITASKNRRRYPPASAPLQQVQIEIELSPLLPPKRGLKKSALKTLPKMMYAKAAHVEKQPECVICLTEFEEGDEIRKLPQSKHEFHIGCIDKWLRAQPSCPSCWREVVVVPTP